jgi:hypothetical protein
LRPVRKPPEGGWRERALELTATRRIRRAPRRTPPIWPQFRTADVAPTSGITIPPRPLRLLCEVTFFFIRSYIAGPSQHPHRGLLHARKDGLDETLRAREGHLIVTPWPHARLCPNKKLERGPAGPALTNLEGFPWACIKSRRGPNVNQPPDEVEAWNDSV